MHMNAMSMSSDEFEWDSGEDFEWEWDIPQQGGSFDTFPMNRRGAAILEGELEARRLTLSFLWKKRFFALCADFSFCRYNGAELRHSAAITRTTSVSKRGDREFVLAFVQPELRYHIRAASADQRDRWVAALQSCIQRASAPAPSQPAAVPSSSPALGLLPSSMPSSATPLPAVNFATEWLDENGCVCPKVVDYASQCPKGHPLAPLAGAGSGAAAQRVMCRVCHSLSEREHASQWLTCSVPWCCAGYAVCDGCVRALHQAPAAVAAGEGFSSQVNRAAGAADALADVCCCRASRCSTCGGCRSSLARRSAA
jgi:hypothetical protein